jgi:hypothetical protein
VISPAAFLLGITMPTMNRGRMFALLSLSLSACSFSGSDGTPGGGGNGDPDGGMTDAMPIDAPPAPPKCEFSEIDMCAETASGPLSFTTNTTIDTSVDSMCPHIIAQGTDEPQLCVYYAESISIAGNVTVRAIGARPLVFVSRKGISITGTLNASSTRATNNTAEVVGAGAESAPCESFPDSPGNAAGGGGGGAGGSFSGKGGNGGEGDDPNIFVPNDGVDGGTSPTATRLQDLEFFRGGCRGQTGGDDGDGANDDEPGAGGPPGGVLYLAASGDISVQAAGRIAANGGGGRGGGFRNGGGGGGSGGMILLEARTVERFGMVVANGGGGGEGGGTAAIVNVPSAGSSGNDGGMSGNGAGGGNNDLISGAGGEGSDASRRDGRSGNDSLEGGPGGGGAAGFIRIIGTPTGTGIVSPTASPAT